MADDDNKDGKGNDDKGDAKTFSQEDLNTIVKNRVKETTDSLTKIFDEKFTAVNETISKLTEEKTVVTNKALSDKEVAAAALKTAEGAMASMEDLKDQLAKKDEAIVKGELDSKETKALIAAGFGAEGAGLLLSKLVDSRQVVDGKTVYKDGDMFTDQASIVGGLVKTFPMLIVTDRANGHKVATKDSKIDAGKNDVFHALLNKKDKTQAETLELSRMANEMKKDQLGE